MHCTEQELAQDLQKVWNPTEFAKTYARETHTKKRQSVKLNSRENFMSRGSLNLDSKFNSYTSNFFFSMVFDFRLSLILS